MDVGFWLSALLGLCSGGIYVLFAYLSFRTALKKSNHSFMMIVLGGIAIRLFGAAAFIALVIALAPIHEVAFLTAFFIIFLIGLILEVVVINRHLGKMNQVPK